MMGHKFIYTHVNYTVRSARDPDVRPKGHRPTDMRPGGNSGLRMGLHSGETIIVELGDV